MKSSVSNGISAKKAHKGDDYQPEMTFQEIANILGVSKQRAEQIEKRALKKLRNPKVRDRWERILETVQELNTKPSYGSGKFAVKYGTHSIDPKKVDDTF